MVDVHDVATSLFTNEYRDRKLAGKLSATKTPKGVGSVSPCSGALACRSRGAPCTEKRGRSPQQAAGLFLEGLAALQNRGMLRIFKLPGRWRSDWGLNLSLCARSASMPQISSV